LAGEFVVEVDLYGIVSNGDDEVLVRKRQGEMNAGKRSLYAIERLLRGEQVPLFVMHEWFSDRETVLTVSKQGQTYLGIWAGDPFKHERDDYTYGFEPVEVTERALREFYPVDELVLAKTILTWVEGAVKGRDHEFTESPADELSGLVRDAHAVVSYYETHGDLSGFEYPRTQAELRRFVFEREELPRTPEFVREHGLVRDVVLDMLASDLDDETVADKLRAMVEEEDWVTKRGLETLIEHPDERAVDACAAIFRKEPEIKRLAARLICNLTDVEHDGHCGIEFFIVKGLACKPEPTTRNLLEAAQDDLDNDFRVN
jgi:hypothetical protein